MAPLKAVLFALLVINFQAANSFPTPESLSERVYTFLIDYWPTVLITLKPIEGDILEIVQKAKGAVSEALTQDQITLDQAKEIIQEVVGAALNGELSALSEIDISLEEAVNEEIIDTDTKVKILLAAIREDLHKEPPPTLEEAVAAAVDAAVASSIIDEDTADAIKDAAPGEVEPDPEATISAEDVENAIGAEVDPVGIQDEIREIAEKARDALNEGALLGLITKSEAEEVNDLIWEAAKSNDLTIWSEVDIALAACVDEEIIDDVAKVEILVNAIKEGLHNDAPDDLSEAVAAVVDAALEAELVDEDTADALKETAPDVVDPDPEATLSAEDVDAAV